MSTLRDMKGHEREVAVLADALGGGTIAVRHAEHVLRELWSRGMWIGTRASTPS